MKKLAFALLVLFLGYGLLFAQEIPEGMTPEELEAIMAKMGISAPAETPTGAAPAAPAGPTVKTAMGELSIDGRVIAGFEAKWSHQYDEDYSSLSGINSQMGENRAELSFHLKNGNFGEFIMLRAQLYGPNNNYYDGNYNPENNTLNYKDYGYNKGAGFTMSAPYFFA